MKNNSAGSLVHTLVCLRLQKTFAYCFACDVLQASPFLSKFSSKKIHDDAGSGGTRHLETFALIGAGVSGFLGFTTVAASSDEAEHGLACPSYPWPHKGILSSYDHAS